MKYKIKLYHGSRSGIKGPIVPKSRMECDFGCGFYMGTNVNQPLTLIYNAEDPVLYTVEIDLEGLNVLELDRNIEWAMVVAYHRGYLDAFKHTDLYRYISKLVSGKDLIQGAIADDRMFIVLDRFFNGVITDEALIHCLSDLDLGIQYVAVTEKACKQIKILEQRKLTDSEKTELKVLSDNNRKIGVDLVNSVSRQYRRIGKYFDEIVEDYHES